ncbi:PAS domain-containing sensor histidine kinase [Desulfovibrio ferrophilus]|uniref:histidine kinase n=1 Tax=Desulfovibrio ferrophilus TaxID=241368 RepID=A0A2Z6AVF5_9BACT|nr:PAS domain-containing sensor histidine kinase [Desulfovibrio ferrophilus]BBD07200.1 two-component sensor kinase [Desulfovibrio ferrophilus]
MGKPGDSDFDMIEEPLDGHGHFVAAKMDLECGAEGSLLSMPSYDLLPDPVLAFEMLADGLPGKILFANQIFLERMGYDAKTLALTPPVALHHQSRYPFFEQGVRDLQAMGTLTAETLLLSASGREISMEVNARYVQLNGRPASLVVYRDLSRRKMVEQALQTARLNYQRIFDMAVQGVFQSTLGGRFIKVNPAMARMLGYASPEELVLTIKDMRFDLYASPEDRERYLDILRSSGEVERFETRFKCKNGSEIWVSLSTRLISGDTALDSFIEGFCIEITERKEAEEALRESEALHRVMLMSLSDTVCISDEAGRFTYISPNTERLFGLSPEEVGNLGTVQALLGGLLIETSELDERGEVPNVEVEVPVGEHRRTLLVTVKRVDICGGTRLYACRDVTENKELHAEAMRAAHLASLGELAAGVAHEINNPINGIVLWAEYLQDEAPDLGDAEDAPERILKQGERVAAIVRNLLSFARKPDDEAGPVDVREILEDSLGLTRARMEKDGIILELYAKSPMPRIKGRDQEVQQVFVNLLSNARDALNARYAERHPAKRLAISLKAIERDGVSYVRATFTDFGIGIPSRDKERIFNPFYSTKPKHQGTGLGLSTSHRIMADLGGRLAIHSEEKSYTRAVVEFPVWNDTEGVGK